MPDDSLITYSSGCTTFVGPDAINFLRAASLYSALGLLEKGICPTRGFTRKKGLALASEYTKKIYPAHRASIAAARADLKVWIDAMRLALPTEVKP